MEPNGISRAVATAMTLITAYGLQVIGAVLILIAGRIASGFAAKATRNALVRVRADEALARFVTSLARTAVMVFAVIAALRKFGIETTSFVAVLGAAGFAVGLALQGSLSNFAAGVLILIFRPFKIGDVIDAAGRRGKVVEIGIFTTILDTPDHQRVIVPNAAITSGTIVNVNAYDTRRVDLTAGIGYGDDIGKARRLLLEFVAAHEKVLADPPPTVEVVELGESSVNFVVRPWVKTPDYWRVRVDLPRAIKETFDENGITIPYPQREVHVHREPA